MTGQMTAARGVARGGQGPMPPIVDWVDFLKKKLALLGLWGYDWAQLESKVIRDAVSLKWCTVWPDWWEFEQLLGLIAAQCGIIKNKHT